MQLNDVRALSRLGIPGRSLRIAMISDCASPVSEAGGIVCSGQSVHVGQLARELARAGHVVDIFTRRDGGHPEVAHLDEGVRLIQVPAGYLPKEQMLPHVAAFSRSLSRFVRRQPGRYDIVHAHFFTSGMAAQHLKEAFGLPFVITFHALGGVRRRAHAATDTSPIRRIQIESSLMRAADRIIAECPQDRLDMERLYGAPGPRMAVVPCGFSPDELWPVPMAEARARLGLEHERFTVLYLGRLLPRKGVDTVIQGVAMLRHRYGVDAQLLVAGGDATAGAQHEGVELARLRNVAADAGIAAHVRFAGQLPRSRLRDCYSAAHVFASTPWYEPFGITPVEAMACARPVIGAELGGIKDTVHDGVTGFLIPSRDPEALAERLARLHRHPALAQGMGLAGRRRACEHYTWRQVAAQLADIYAEVLDDIRPAACPATRFATSFDLRQP